MKTYYDEKPAVIEAVGNGGYYYRWNIKEVQIESEDAPRAIQILICGRCASRNPRDLVHRRPTRR